MIGTLLVAAAIYLGLRFVVFRQLLAIPPSREAPRVILMRWALSLLAGAAIAAALLALTILPGAISGYFIFLPGAPDPATAVELQNTYPMLALAAMGEELVYRGILPLLLVITLGYMLLAVVGKQFTRMRSVQATLWLNAAVISSAVFSFAHAENPAVVKTALVNIFLVGLLLSLTLLYTRGLTMAFGFHFGWNALLEVVNLPVSGLEFSTRWHPFTIVPQGAPMLTGGSFGPEASAVLTGLLIAANAAGVYGYLRLRRPSGDAQGEDAQSKAFPGIPPPPEDTPSEERQ